jgi:hypothetical protein
MATRVQSLLQGLGKAKEADYNTASSTFVSFPKINMDIVSPLATNEDNADWIGKGNEFATQLFKTNVDVSGRLQKYGSAEFLTYILAYGLGGVAEATGVYTLTPINPATTLQLPSFSVVEQLPEGGSTAIDNMYTGCVVDSLSINFSYGAGLKSVTSEMTFRGSGEVTTPSGIDLPAATAEHHALSAGMTMTINGVDYVAAATGLSGSFTWYNGLLADQGYYVGSGLDANGYAVRNRLEYGKRVATLEFTARLLATSTEFAKLQALTIGSGTLTFLYDSTHTVSIAFTDIGFEKVENTQVEGLVAVKVTAKPIFNSTLLTVTAKCGVTGIAQ